MALSLLPRGIAAKRVATPNVVNEQPEQMQLDGPHSPTSSSTEAHSHTLVSLHVPRSKRLVNQLPQSKGGYHQQKSAKPIKPQELCVLVETAMSDYALWTNPDLRRYAADRNTSGYLSLSRLLNESPLIQATGQTIVEASVFQALKDYGSGFLELQLKLTTAARNRQKSGVDSLYNIRRVDWEDIRTKLDPSNAQGNESTPTLWDRSESAWNERTIYAENIPRKYWTLPAALLFIHSCAQPTSNVPSGTENLLNMEMDAKATSTPPTIQHFELPAHAKASQNDVPVCKGFAFITFSEVQHAESFVTTWPWNSSRQAESSKDEKDDEGDDEDVGEQLMNLDLTKEKDQHEEAVKEGKESCLRSISLNAWEELKKEYLTWQADLYENMKSSEPKVSKSNTKAVPVQIVPKNSTQKPREMPPHLAAAEKGSDQRKQGPAETYEQQNYPSECLLFVKNLHPQTNKTTLKKLFEHGLQSSGKVDSGGIDYVDWSKGMSSCHLRLSDPTTAQLLVGHFAGNQLVQINGDGDQGQAWAQAATSASVVESGLKPLVTELVQGRAEEIYWEKVPQKIRAAAISKSKAISLAAAKSQTGPELEVDRRAIKRGSEEPKDSERENKRRRKA